MTYRSRSSTNLALSLTIALGFAFGLATSARADTKLELKKGDHIALIGNTLADRMQHDGWLETLLAARFPEHDLTIRNLGFSGDELTLRLRSAAFGSPDEWLTKVGADVVFAFFGYNESFAGKQGLPKFKADLEDFIKKTRAQKYNGKSAPRIVLFSPIAHENLKSANLPDGVQNNERIALYSAAIADAAKANNLTYIDLFGPTKDLYAKSDKPLTINGVHLNGDGNKSLARVILNGLFTGTVPELPAGGSIGPIHEAVLEKNHLWFNRYRTLDGYSIYGGRADLKFTNGQTNREVAQREMEVLDVMTENRDKRIWAVAKGGDPKVDDTNTPPFVPVVTNKPGTGHNGEHIFLDGDEAISKMTVAKNLKVNLFASEKQFPDLAKPVQMAFDTKGRLWVASWPTYPHWKPKTPMNDKILIFEDTDGDGRADKETVFADGLHCPTGFELYNGGVLVAQAPDLMFLKDTDGDDKADIRQRVLSGLDSADSHHTSNSFQFDPGGALYFQEGTFHHTQVETPYGPSVRNANAAVFRYEPRAQKFEVYVPYGFANPHGHAFDRWGQDIVTDGTGANPYHAALFSGHLDYPVKHARPPQVYQQRTRPCSGIETLSSRHFPESWQGNLLVCNVIGFQGILRYRLDDKGASFMGTEEEPVLSSTDPMFRPADLKMGPDGAIYFIDWINPIIGHMQHNLRDPNRDASHGRIYRITYEGRPLVKPAKIEGESTEKLIELLKEHEDRTRYRARIELASRPVNEVLAAAGKWLASLDKNDSEFEHQRLEALWLHQSHNVVNIDLLKQVLQSPDFRAKAAATRVLCYWRDRVPGALDLLKTLAADPYPRVRLEAVRAASFFTEPDALEIALISADQPSDEYIDFVRGETLKALEPYWKKAVAEGKPINFTSDSGARYFLRSVSTDELLKLKRTRVVDLELLSRKGVRDEDRKSALADLAKLENKGELKVLVDAIRTMDGDKGAREESVVFDLVRLLTSRTPAELAEARADLEALARDGGLPVTRQLGYVALIAADSSVDKAWTIGTRSAAALQDLLGAMPLIRDPEQRAALYPKVLPLLNGLPGSLASANSNSKGTHARYIRVELPGRRRTLTLAEVEVMSDGRNVARRGKASQSSTANGGDAAKAIDGNTSGTYSAGGQTHSSENTDSPWWEVDLGAELPVDYVLVYNRTDEALGKRLQGFNVKALDNGRNVVFEKARIAAPNNRESIVLGGAGPEGAVRHAAMNALTYVRGKELDTFRAIESFVLSGSDRHAAVQAILRIPTADWPKDQARPLLDSLLAYVKSVPASDRTTPAVADALQMSESLASLLPRDQSLAARRALGDLGVRVLKLGTVVDQMLFDKDKMAVRAGKPVEVVFENNDLMPHNFVVTKPGALEEVGLLAESSATEPGALERNYVPRSNKILFATRLLQPRELETIKFDAPSEAGVYPYVCTYPGHWRRMYGALYVVEDLDDYLSDPESYLSRHPLPIKDDLLKSNRTRKEWTFNDLAEAVGSMKQGQSYANGKQMFVVANCVACHRMNNIGEQIGQDLTQVTGEKATPEYLLKNVLDPSLNIEDKYRSYNFELASGKVVTGMILEETNDRLTYIENPVAKSPPVILKKSEIVERAKSPSSIMPKGLLDKLTRDEILDLMAYVLAKGDAKNPLFHLGAGHAHGGH